MESSVGRSGGAETSKKTRLLDIQSLYNSRDFKEVGKNKENGTKIHDNINIKKKRKSRKEVSLSSLEPVAKKSRKPFDKGNCEGFSSCSNDSVQGCLDLNGNLDGSNGLSGVSFSLDGNSNGNVICVPKRPRGSVRNKKVESNKVSKALRSSSPVDRITRLNSEKKKRCRKQVLKTIQFSGSKSGSSESKPKLNEDCLDKIVSPCNKWEYDDVNGKNGRVNPEQCAKEDDSHMSSVNNGDTSSKKHRKKCKKKVDIGSDSQSLACKIEPLAVNSSETCGDFGEDDDDEENLEQNAARMLSSRFDPSCTGFHSRGKPSQSSPANGLSFLIPSFRDFTDGESKQIAGTDVASSDTLSRVLRPRRQHKEKRVSRKRRHFYEIRSSDLDAYWVLNRRIKVLWPLDESWYYGLVDDYDPGKSLHHIKYDDRDEEWIDLDSERFKLLLLPGEVPGNIKRMSGSDDTKNLKRTISVEDDSYIGSYMDSEPIISWLARSSRRVKCSSNASKKHKMVRIDSDFSQPLSGRSNDVSREDVVFEDDLTEALSMSVLPNVPVKSAVDRRSVGEMSSSSKGSKCCIVYFRRRIRQKCISKSKDGCIGESLSTLVPVVDSFETVKGNNMFTVESAGPTWFVDDAGFLKLTIPLVKSKHFRLELCIPLSSILECTFVADDDWILHALLLLQHGSLVNLWPKVYLEMLFVDNVVGLRFLLYEGYLKQAVALVFMILTLFYQPNERGNGIDLQMPVTSIRFKLSSAQDLRKQYVFAFYSFCKVNHSLWLYVDSEFGRQCVLTKQLPLSECTYDNIKTMEGGSRPLQVNCSYEKAFLIEGLRSKPLHTISSFGAPKGSYNVKSNHLLCYSDGKYGKLPPFALSFTAAPTFFLGLHLQLLMKRSITSVSLQDNNSVYVLGCSEKTLQSSLDDSQAEVVSQISRLPTCTRSHLRVDALPIANCIRTSEISESTDNANLVVAVSSACSKNLQNGTVDGLVQPNMSLESRDRAPGQSAIIPKLMGMESRYTTSASNTQWISGLNGMHVEIPCFDPEEKPFLEGSFSSYQASDLAWNINDGYAQSPIPTGPRSLWHRSRNISTSLYSDLSHGYSDGKINLVNNSFNNGPKKPRTQVHYTLPYEGLYFGSKHKVHSHRGPPFKRIRRAHEKRISDGTRVSQKNLELLACDANVLITHMDRGWRECGARIVLELADQNEWRLAVKLSGMTKYSYKVRHVLQPGTTNRYTHAMMWKGGKDWVLEFPDRSQWMLFKEMHEECYNRNIRAALVRNIPIPGVYLIEECDDGAAEVSFTRNSPKYFRQVETDVDMAMNPSRVLYDMDSDDEKWVSTSGNIFNMCENKIKEISEDMFEKVMDMFEKVAYAQKCNEFTPDRMEELMAGVGPLDIIKMIYEHWHQKRKKKRMPLIRHFQPPLWENYQQQVKEWEQTATVSVEKPPMFAFCMKPRGLELPNKGSKHRSQKKFHVSGHSLTVPVDQDGIHALGRRSNGLSYGDDKFMFSAVGHDRADGSPVSQASARAFSPVDVGGSAYFSLNHGISEWNHCPKLYKNNSKKMGTFSLSGNPQIMSTGNHRTGVRRNGVNRWVSALEQPNQPHYQVELMRRHVIEQFDGSDLQEFRLHDASGAARHALNVAKIKRERAQKLLCRADEAIHKATVALLTADAVRAAFENLNDDG